MRFIWCVKRAPRAGVGLLIAMLMLMATSYEVWGALQSRGAATDEHGAIHYRATSEAIVALTFDDGPHPTYTPQILDVLKAHDVHATFFVLGSRAKENPAILKRLVEEGNEIGNHGFSHTYRINSAQIVHQEIERTDDVLFDILGIRTHYFRPPGGIHNPMVVKAAADVGHEVVMWSWNQDTRDWARPGVQTIVGHVLDNVRPGDIVLFHDDGGQGQTVKALGEIIEGLEARHFRIVTVSELLSESTPATARAR